MKWRNDENEGMTRNGRNVLKGKKWLNLKLITPFGLKNIIKYYGKI